MTTTTTQALKLFVNLDNNWIYLLYLFYIQKRFSPMAVVVMVKWSACFPSTPTIQVWTCSSLQFFCKIAVEKKQKEAVVFPFLEKNKNYVKRVQHLHPPISNRLRLKVHPSMTKILFQKRFDGEEFEAIQKGPRTRGQSSCREERTRKISLLGKWANSGLFLK